MLSKTFDLRRGDDCGECFTGDRSRRRRAPEPIGAVRCEPQPAPCRSGQTFTVTQNGDQIEVKSDDGLAGSAKLTSRISLSGLPPWNSLGVITADDRIEWSNGTQWRKL